MATLHVGPPLAAPRREQLQQVVYLGLPLCAHGSSAIGVQSLQQPGSVVCSGDPVAQAEQPGRVAQNVDGEWPVQLAGQEAYQ